MVLPLPVRHLLVACVLAVTGACQGPQPQREMTVGVPPVVVARTLLPTLCTDTSPEERAAVLNRLPRPLAVERAERTVNAGKLSPRSVLAGVSIVLPAPPNATPAWLQRVLTCHAADVALGKVPVMPDDPFSDVQTWLQMAARSVGSTVVVQIEPMDRAEAGHVLERADRWGRFPVTP